MGVGWRFDMPSSLRSALSVLLLVLPATNAQAAAVARPAMLELSINLLDLDPILYDPYGFVCYGCPQITVQRAATVTVDPMLGRIGVAASALTLGAPIQVLIDSTAISSITMTRLSNLSGTFSVGGAAGGAGEPACPVGPGGACVPQSGFGGPMGLTGTYNIHIIPNVVVIPIALGPLRFGLGGAGVGAPPTEFAFDAAPWTVGRGEVALTGSTSAATGSIGTSSFRLVTPTFVSALGNLLPIFATLTVSFTDGLGVPGFVSGRVPEPALAVLILGAAGLGALLIRRGPGRRRPRKP
jgi:hypothetical protein